MLLAAADPSSYSLFSGVIRSFCFIIEWRQTMPLGSCITCCIDSLFHSEAYNMLAYLHLVLIVSVDHRNNVKRILHNSLDN